jgi:hypothetical protein
MAYLPESTANHNTVPGHYQLFSNSPPADQAASTDHRSLQRSSAFSFCAAELRLNCACSRDYASDTQPADAAIATFIGVGIATHDADSHLFDRCNGHDVRL